MNSSKLLNLVMIISILLPSLLVDLPTPAQAAPEARRPIQSLLVKSSRPETVEARHRPGIMPVTPMALASVSGSPEFVWPPAVPPQRPLLVPGNPRLEGVVDVV